MLYVVCCMSYAICCTLYAVCCMLYVVRCMLYVVCCIFYVVFCLLYVVCLMYVVCCMLYVVYSETVCYTHCDAVCLVFSCMASCFPRPAVKPFLTIKFGPSCSTSLSPVPVSCFGAPSSSLALQDFLDHQWTAILAPPLYLVQSKSPHQRW